jgi:N-acetylglucosaminyldiphosphoundecaprenol N-acetyl-beta-D-mannosaminyltransferase
LNGQASDKHILKMRVNDISLINTIGLIKAWSIERSSRYICVSNVHMCMETFDSDSFRVIVNNSDLIVADGKPLAIGLKMLGCKDSEQIRGADLTRAILADSEKAGRVIGLYGATSETVNKISLIINTHYPNIKIGCAISPPFRPLTDDEDNEYVKIINDAQVQILLVGLGCPKQEEWMAEHKGKVKAVMIGVGAVFDFLSGNKKEAPKWVHNLGLEWAFRLLNEPHRLWKRYAIHNPRFVWHFTKQLLKQ